MARGVLAKDTHGSTIRLAPPLWSSDDDLDWMADQLEARPRELIGPRAGVPAGAAS